MSLCVLKSSVKNRKPPLPNVNLVRITRGQQRTDFLNYIWNLGLITLCVVSFNHVSFPCIWMLQHIQHDIFSLSLDEIHIFTSRLDKGIDRKLCQLTNPIKSMSLLLLVSLVFGFYWHLLKFLKFLKG